MSPVENNTSLQRSETVSERVKARAKREVWSYALFRPESAVVIALTVIGAGLATLSLPWFPGTWWMWLAGGVIGEGAIVLSTLRDKMFYERLLGKMFYEQFDLDLLRSSALQLKMRKALEYRTLIVDEIHRKEDVFDGKLLDTVRGMEDWIAQIYRLAVALDTYLNDSIIMRDRGSAPMELLELQSQRIKKLADPVREELERTIAMKQSQIDAHGELFERMSRAQLQLDNTLAAMGTVYMQAKVFGSKDVDSSRAKRLQSDMIEQVRALEDTAQAMDEIYRSNLSAARS